MKKNLRIVSAAAAALLAVAPVAASAVSANAAVTVNDGNNSSTASTETVKADATVTINVSVNATAGNTSIKDAIDSVNVTADGATLVGFNKKNNEANVSLIATDKDGKSQTLTAADKGNMDAEHTYKVVVKGLSLNNLTTGKQYAIAGGSFATKADTKDGYYSAKALAGDLSEFTSDPFSLTNATLTGTPYFVKGNSAVTDGSVTVNADAKNNVKVSDVESAIENTYQPTVDGSATILNDIYSQSVKSAVTKALSDANINVKNREFAAPANSFVVNVSVQANNGKTATLPVTVNVTGLTAANHDAYPQISYNGKTLAGTDNKVTLSDTAKFNYVPVNGKVDTKAIENAFSATVSKKDTNTLNVSVDASKVNTAVAGKYPVTVSATNANGKKSSVTFELTVGAKDATYKEVKSEGNVYTINGNEVTQTATTVKKGTQIATYGSPKALNGKNYIRINGATSNQWVETSVFEAPKVEPSKNVQVKYVSAHYNEKMESTHQKTDGYKYLDLVVDKNGELKPYNLKDSKGKVNVMYKIANKDEYVRARNVTGSKMTLKHNAYVYKSNGKRANKKVLKKGRTITVYGGSYKAIKKYKGKAVRIGVNRYIKTANVNYKLDK